MSIPRRQQRMLEETGDAICRSDPRLASMTALFTRLFAQDDLPACEQLSQSPLARCWAAVAAAATARARSFRVAASLRASGRASSARYPSPLPPDPIAAAGPSPLPPDRDCHDGLTARRP
jgi:hypothetical protein